MPLCPNGGRATQKCVLGSECPPGYGCTPLGGCCLLSLEPACPAQQSAVCQCSPTNACPLHATCTMGTCCTSGECVRPLFQELYLFTVRLNNTKNAWQISRDGHHLDRLRPIEELRNSTGDKHFLSTSIDAKEISECTLGRGML